MFSATTAFEEDYILPLSYKEFVYGKRSLLEKFPGLEAEKMAGVRSFFGFMMAFPGKKMSFMGSEFGQVSQWDYHGQLEWDLLENEGHRQMQTWHPGSSIISMPGTVPSGRTSPTRAAFTGLTRAVPTRM